MYRTASLIALGTALCLAGIHLLAVAGYSPLGMAAVFPAFLVTFACFAAALHDQRRRKLTSPFDIFAGWPPWAGVLFGLSFVYAGVNFVWFLAATGGGTLLEQDGRTVLTDHGRIIRTLDAAGIRAFHSWEVRLFSGHILPFLILSGIYFLVRSRDASTITRAHVP